MKPTIYLRIASVLTFIHAVAHTIGGVLSSPEPGIAAATVEVMKANQFVVFATTRSYFLFYRGLGLGITIFLTFEAIAFWLLAGMAKEHAGEMRPLFAVFMLAYLVFAVNSFLYFFYVPVIVEVLISMCFAMAIFTAKSAQPAQA